DARAAELRERIARGARRHNRAIRQVVTRAVVIRDDYLEPERTRLGDLLHGGDAAVHCQDEAVALFREPRQRLAPHAVPLLEAAWQVPADVGTEFAEDEDSERSRADPVDVVVAVDADALARGNRGVYRRAGLVDGSEQLRIVQRRLAGEKGLCLVGVAVPAPDEDARCRLRDPERRSEGA